MPSIYQIIDFIAATSSTNKKKIIIESHKDNELLKKCFQYAYNSRLNFWLKSNLIPTESGTNDISDATFDVLDTLVNRTVTGDAAREFVHMHMQTLTSEAQIVMNRVMQRDLRCGASDTLASKIWKNLVPEFPVMLCQKYNVKTEKYLKKFEETCGYSVELKADGGRLLVTVDYDGTVTLRSRNGSPVETYGLFDQYYSSFVGNVFDGELIIKNADGTPDRKKSNGIYTKLIRGTATKEEVALFSIVMWDIIPLDEYLAGKGTTKYSLRWDKLFLLNLVWKEFGGKVYHVYGKKAKTLAECLTFYDEMREAGQEGAIIKVMDSLWEDRRSNDCVKLKAEDSIDLLCIGVEEGSGKYAGMIGALIMVSGCGNLRVNVGTGLKDDDRAKDPSYYIGYVHELGYNEVITSKSKTTSSLFLPVYKQRRDDKIIPNDLKDVI